MPVVGCKRAHLEVASVRAGLADVPLSIWVPLDLALAVATPTLFRTLEELPDTLLHVSRRSLLGWIVPAESLKVHHVGPVLPSVFGPG